VGLSYRYNGRMRQALKVHPDSLCSAVTYIEVDVMRPCAGSLVLSYLVTGRIGDLRIPAAAAAARTDELWRHTCFEAFVRTSPNGGPLLRDWVDDARSFRLLLPLLQKLSD
jgi:hypothetical protein